MSSRPCPACGRPCANEKAFQIHYSGKHGRPYPWEDPDSDYGPVYRQKREKALERDGYACQECGAAKTEDSFTVLHVHHVDGDASNNRLRNLRTLCAGCHTRAHRSPGEVVEGE